MEFYTGHIPKIVRLVKPGHELHQKIAYMKRESDSHFLHRKTRSFSVNAEVLEKNSHIEYVVIHHIGRKLILCASRAEILAHNHQQTYFGERKFYYPCERWELIRGSERWLEKLYRDVGIETVEQKKLKEIPKEVEDNLVSLYGGK